jgi:drug/metabolite transporter (DMT)-like permease
VLTAHPLAIHLVSLNPAQAVGIPIALVGAVFLSFGAQFQHRGVAKVESVGPGAGGGAGTGLSVAQLLALLSRPSWVLGTLLIGLAVVLQLTSLRFAPLIVVQPLGAVALVITAVLNARITHTKLNHRSVRAIAFCVGGVGLFVTIAAFTAIDARITDLDLIVVLLLLAGVLTIFGTLFVIFHDRMGPVAYIVGAGVLYGFVVTLAKVVINRILQAQFDPLTICCVVGLLAAGAVGAYFVQTAYSVGPPDLVIAGLTVVDPLVAVGIGVVVLREAAEAPWWAPIVYVLTGLLAVYGVFSLARNHPQLKEGADPFERVAERAVKGRGGASRMR